MGNHVELQISDLEKPFEGVEWARKGPDLHRTVIWQTDRGLVRATRTTSGSFEMTLGVDGHLESSRIISECDAKPSYHIEYVFPSGQNSLVAYSSWGVEVDEDKASIMGLRGGLRRLDGVRLPDGPTPEEVFAEVDEVRRRPAEMMIFRKDIIDPDVLSVEGLFAILATKPA